MSPSATVGRPGRFLSAEWRWLAMINYRIDPEVLTPLVPNGTELDLFRGEALVSMVGFRFLRTRVLGVPVPYHRDFDEVNLRFYVRRRAADGVRRGVVFVKEIVPRAAIAWVARTVYGENYVRMPMRHRLPEPGAPRLRFEWRHRDRWDRLALTPDGRAALPPEGSEKRFIAEHYWGYSAKRDGRTVEYRVEHPPWRVRDGLDPTLDCDVERLYGRRFAPWLAAAPTSAFVAEGSEVTVRRGRPLDPG